MTGIASPSAPASRFGRRKVLWLVPLFLILHNLEEGIAGPGWQAAHAELLSRFGLPLWKSPRDFYLALLVVSVIPLALTAWAWRGRDRSFRLATLFVVQALVFINAWVPHILASLVLRAYTPGLITALLFNVPFTIYIFRRGLKDGWIGTSRTHRNFSRMP